MIGPGLSYNRIAIVREMFARREKCRLVQQPLVGGTRGAPKQHDQHRQKLLWGQRGPLGGAVVDCRHHSQVKSSLYSPHLSQKQKRLKKARTTQVVCFLRKQHQIQTNCLSSTPHKNKSQVKVKLVLSTQICTK